MTIVDAADSFNSFSEGLEGMIMDVVESHSGGVVDIIRQQLLVGKDGNDDPLRPTYLEDPWFLTDESGNWKNRARAYMLWKKKITPPNAWLGYPARSISTPNLIITGDFHNSIKMRRSDDRFVFYTEGTSFGDNVVKKYGIDILKVGSGGMRHLIDSWVRPRMETYFSMCGL